MHTAERFGPENGKYRKPEIAEGTINFCTVGHRSQSNQQLLNVRMSGTIPQNNPLYVDIS